jgi:hypothetical protein
MGLSIQLKSKPMLTLDQVRDEGAIALRSDWGRQPR